MTEAATAAMGNICSLSSGKMLEFLLPTSFHLVRVQEMEEEGFDDAERERKRVLSITLFRNISLFEGGRKKSVVD